MPCKAILKLAAEEREESKDYLQLQNMSQGQSLQEVVYGVMANTFLGVQESKPMPLPSGPLSLKWAWWVPAILLAPSPCVE